MSNVEYRGSHTKQTRYRGRHSRRQSRVQRSIGVVAASLVMSWIALTSS